MKTVLKRASPFLISTIFHILAFMLVFSLQNAAGKGDSDQEGGSGNSATDEKVQPKITEVELLPPPDLPDDIEATIPKPPEPPKPDALTECEHDSWYGGIGMQQDPFTGIISEVYSGYPAEKAGLKVGDRIGQVSSDDGSEIRGTPGTKVQLWIYKQGDNLGSLVEVTRDRICLYKKLDEKPKGLDLNLIPRTFEDEGP